MENEITLRQHWYVVPEVGVAESHILDLIALEETQLEVEANLERNQGALQVWRRF